MDIWGKPEQMDCKQFERLIPGFIAGELDYPDLKKFYEHMEQCADCKEELDIQFLVMQGIQRLEDGSAFDLQFELRQRLEETKRKIRFHSVFQYLGVGMEIVAAGMLAGIVIWILL